MTVDETIEAIRAMDLEGIDSVSVKASDLVQMANTIQEQRKELETMRMSLRMAESKIDSVLAQGLKKERILDEYA